MTLRTMMCHRWATAVIMLLIVATDDALSQTGQPMTTPPPIDGEPTIEERIVVDRIWSAVRVGFCLLTHDDRQYVACYNADRRMVVAMRLLAEDQFGRFVLPSRSADPPRGRGESSTIQGWDSHNYITMAVDRTGHIHLAGNMHANALTYFRTTTPGDITTLTQIDAMVGTEESRCTYPVFMQGPGGELIFHFRDGYSGSGQEIYNVYDADQQQWRRMLAQPLLSGQGQRNAYQRGPVRGPDGWYHMIWMWRDTPDVATNHDLSYARSRDLLQWETAAGEPLPLPITIESPGTIIDPVPVNGGLHNSAHRLGFDRQHRVVVTYYKHDDHGDTQAYAARFDDDGWRVRQVSDWKGQHIFRGGGSGPSTFGTSIALGAVTLHGEDQLALSFSHWKAGRGLLIIDEATLEPLGVAPASAQPQLYPAALTQVTSDFPGMRVNWSEDKGRAAGHAGRYVLRWETLGTNRDRPREGPLPENSELVLYRFLQPQGQAVPDEL
jgi:hypothetical protein